MAEPTSTVTITYRKAGTKPPLFVAGSFSRWLPQEMDYTTEENGEHVFKKDVAIEPHTRIQYKFRVGEGDWWVLDEKAPTATDGLGNTNNVLEAPSIEDAPAEDDPEDEQTDKTRTEQLTADVADERDASTGGKSVEHPPEEFEAHVEPDSSGAAPSGENLRTFGDDETKSPSTPESKEPVENGLHSEKVHLDPTEATEDSDVTKKEDPDLEKHVTPEKQVEPESSTQQSQVSVKEPEPEPEEPAKGAALLQPRTAVDNFKETIARSETSTPVFVKTAAEVADSAALLDKEPPEEDIPDEEAGRLGVRRLSSTPIPQVANTAAEVADTARILDAQEPETSFVVSPVAYHNLAGFKDDIRDDSLDLPAETAGGVPLFAHECVGLYEDDEIPGDNGVETEEERLDSQPLIEEDELDPNDPTLEKFPSNRDEIMNTVLKMETGLNEDQTHFDGVPPSPVVGPSKNSIVEMTGEALLSPQTSPVSARTAKRLDVHKKAPRTSLSSERSLSVLSLGSIAEAEERDVDKTIAEEVAPIVEQASTAEEVISVAKGAEGEVHLASDPSPSVEDIAPVVEQALTAEAIIEVAQEAEGEVSLPSEAEPGVATVVLAPTTSIQSPIVPKAPASDEDEAVDVKEAEGLLTPERATSPKPPASGSIGEPTPNTAPPVLSLDTDDNELTETLAEAGSVTVVLDNIEAHSPSIVIHAAEADQLGDGEGDELPPAALDLDEALSELRPTEEEPERGIAEVVEVTEATPAGVETTTITSTHLTRRGVRSPVERATTPASITDAGREAADSGNWFTAFFKLFFVDWIGGFFRRLFGGGRKELLLTTSTALVVMSFAIAWWRGMLDGQLF